MKVLNLLLITVLFLLFSFGATFAKEPAVPSFQITGYIEKINSDSILVYVPRMKKAISLLLSKKVLVAEFANRAKRYSLEILKEKTWLFLKE